MRKIIYVDKKSVIECPVCHGTGKMNITVFKEVDKKTVRVTCTACHGDRFVPFIDHILMETEVETIESINSMTDGWRKFKEWGKVHYFLEGKSLCGSIHSQQAINRSISIDDVSPDDKCINCFRQLQK